MIYTDDGIKSGTMNVEAGHAASSTSEAPKAGLEVGMNASAGMGGALTE